MYAQNALFRFRFHRLITGIQNVCLGHSCSYASSSALLFGFFFLLFLLNCSCFALDRRRNVHLATANGVSANATCIRYCGNGLCVHGDRDRRCTALLHHATIHTLLLSCSCCKSLPNFPRPCNLPLLHLYGTSCDMPFPLRFQSVYTYTFCSLRLPLNTL